MDRHNDYIQIYVKKEGDDYLLTDGGDTIQDLDLSGFPLDSEKRQNLLKMTLAGFGVEKKDQDELVVRATCNNFPLCKNKLIQAIMAVNDLFYLAKPYITSVFLEDVTEWVDSKNIRYTPKVKFTGKSGYDCFFDFVIPKSTKAPERILKVMNNPSKDAAQLLAFSWFDTKETRAGESKAYAIMNNNDRRLTSSVIDALKNYGIKPVPWSERENSLKELAA